MEVNQPEAKNTNIINLDMLLEILGNPTRRVILSKLAKVPLGASELAASFGTKISRQAIHSQLKILTDNGIIESYGTDPRNIKYRIKSNLSLRIDLSPDYYNVDYRMAEINENSELPQLKDIGCHVDYEKLEEPNDKVRFLGEKINEIEKNIKKLEGKRGELIQDKECLIIELKSLMARQYEKNLRKELPNLEKEIFYTIFYNPMKYFKKIKIDTLLDDMFFSDMDMIRRDQQRVSIKHLLKDLSNLMDFFKEDEDDWFFDI